MLAIQVIIRHAALSLPPPVMRLHELVPLAVVAERLRAERAIVVALEFDDVLILRHLPLGGEARAFAVERQHLAGRVELTLIDPHVGHHRSDPGAEVVFFDRVIA